MSSQKSSTLIPDVLSWSPELLWARYIMILREYEELQGAGKLSVPLYTSMESLTEALQVVRATDQDGRATLRWSVLLLWGYRTFVEWDRADMKVFIAESVHEVVSSLPWPIEGEQPE